LGRKGSDEPTNDVHYHCEFRDGDCETTDSFSPDCGSERISEVGCGHHSLSTANPHGGSRGEPRHADGIVTSSSP